MVTCWARVDLSQAGNTCRLRVEEWKVDQPNVFFLVQNGERDGIHTLGFNDMAIGDEVPNFLKFLEQEAKRARKQYLAIRKRNADADRKELKTMCHRCRKKPIAKSGLHG